MSDEARKAVETAKSVRGVVVEVECPHCHGKKRYPGGKYKDQGEVINCQACNGKGAVRSSIPLGMLYDLLMGNLGSATPLALKAASAAGEFAAQTSIAIGALREIVNYGFAEMHIADTAADAKYLRDIARKALKEIDRINREK